MFSQNPEDYEFYSGTWADQFATYEDACYYYGIDTPAQLEAEDAARNAEAREEAMDEIETKGTTRFDPPRVWDDIPF